MTTVYFGTNRNPRPKNKPTNFGKTFSEDGPSALRFGKAEVTGSRVKVQVFPEKLVPAKNGLEMSLSSSKLGSAALFDGLKGDMKKTCRDTIVLVHGYNVSFKEALKAGATLRDNFANLNQGQGANVVVFSWPSDGSMMPWLAYSSDRRDAAGSGPALARGILKLRDFIHALAKSQACRQEIHLVAHSMGNYVLRHALQEVRRHSPGALPRVFDQILLMAADEDSDAFEHDHKLARLPGLCRHVSVYFNRGDRAMSVSDATKGNPDRLGDDGPRFPFQGATGKVTQVDCSEVVSGAIEHSYYLDAPAVVEDMATVLTGSDPAMIPGRVFVPDRNRFVLEG